MRGIIVAALAIAFTLSMLVGAPALKADPPEEPIVHLQSNDGQRGGGCPTDDFLLFLGGGVYTCSYAGQQIDGTCVYTCTL